MPPGPNYVAGVERTKRAEKHGRLCAITFIQGESDAERATNASMWGTRFARLVRHWRRDLGGVPIILVRLSATNPNPAHFPYWGVVREAQDDAAAKIRNVILVSSDDLPKRAIQPHYTTRGYELLGARMAVAFDAWRAKQTSKQ